MERPDKNEFNRLMPDGRTKVQQYIDQIEAEKRELIEHIRQELSYYVGEKLSEYHTGQKDTYLYILKKLKNGN